MDSVDYQVLQSALKWLRQDKAVAMVTVVRNWGSAPRPPGSLFAVSNAGDFIGSVSGGCIEDDLLARFTAAFPQGVSIARYGIAAADMRRFGLPCGGTLELVVERLHDPASIEMLCTGIESGELLERHVDLFSGAVSVKPGAADFAVRYSEAEMVQVFGPRWRLLIIGAGAVSECLAQMAPALDFAVYINDPREEQQRNWRAEGAQWLAGMPDDAVLEFKPDRRTVIVTLSHDPKIDDMALMEALKTKAFYIGAIGSTASTRARRERLLTLDVTQQELSCLHAPIGLPINSRAPAEIAVSILAELVALRNAAKDTSPASACAVTPKTS